MQRIAIRNTTSPKKIKPRLFDVIIEGKNVKLEIKTTHSVELIDVKDIIKQVQGMRKNHQIAET